MRKLTLLLLILAFQAQSQWYYCSNPWLANYKYRKVITIKQTNISSALTSFPVYVKCDNTIMGALVDQTNFYDIRFTDTTNAVLPYEKDYSTSSGGNFWVNTSLSATASHPTRIYCYYKNSTSQTDGSNQNGTWNSAFKGVWHLPNGTTLTSNDATSNGNNVTVSSPAPTATTGKVDGCATFDGSSTYLNGGTSTSLQPPNHITLSAWAYLTSNVTVRTISCSWSEGGAPFARNGFSLGISDVNTSYVKSAIGYGSSGATYVLVESTGALSLNTWYYLSMVYNGSNVILYINGSSNNSGTAISPPVYTASNRFTIGAFYSGSAYGQYFPGNLDEIRISNTDRSADWIKFEYYNMNDSDQDLTWSSIQTR